MRQFVVERWFLVSLAAVIVAAMSAPEAMRPLADALPRRWIVGGVLFLMALPLEIRAMWRVVRRPLAPALAIGMNFVLLPALAWFVTWLAGSRLSGDLSAGLIVAAAVPCTLASAAVWARRAGGNEAVALSPWRPTWRAFS
jgi:sodium/bile acid cotransporter 7